MWSKCRKNISILPKRVLGFLKKDHDILLLQHQLRYTPCHRVHSGHPDWGQPVILRETLALRQMFESLDLCQCVCVCVCTHSPSLHSDKHVYHVYQWTCNIIHCLQPVLWGWQLWLEQIDSLCCCKKWHQRGRKLPGNHLIITPHP